MKSLIKNIVLCFIISIAFIFTGEAQAYVTGQCSSCHTIHNSQDGSSVAFKLNSSYSGFETTYVSNKRLLKSDCIGCHSSTGTATIVGNIPVIFSTSSFSNPLAGGNFKSVRTDDTTGHNVSGIIAQDGTLGLTPPGGSTMASQLTCAGQYGCHGDTSGGNDNYSALGGAHHVDDTGGITGASVGLSYRFLNGILGKEDANWEQDNTNTSHNEYKGSSGSATDTISYLCSKCHGNYHTWVGGASEVGTSSPWIRHPTDVILPNTGEYASYTTYSMTAPLARPNPDSVSDTTAVSPGTDIVMCLTCHRAHSSPNYKILRWDYKSSTLSTAISGCNVCHTSKN